MRKDHRRRDLHSIFNRSIREERRSIVAWLVGLVAFCLVMLAMYPTVHGNAGFAKLIDAYPEPLKKLFNLSDYTTGAGYLRAEIFSFMAPLLIAIFAILLGSDLIAGEEERRTIDLLLANPVSRRRVVMQKWLSLACGTAVLSFVLELMLGLAGPLFKLHIGWVPLSAEVLGTGLFALAFGTLALAVGAATGSRGAARGISTAVAVAMYLMSTLAQIVTWLKPAQPMSLWYHALGGDPLTEGFRFAHLSVVVLTTVALVGVALFAFDRRDLAT
jgi:ABC-2 type transport system permease protein